MAEAKQWAPSRWSPDKIRLLLKHMRMHVLRVPTNDDYDLEGAGSALMSIDIALSWLTWGLPNDPIERAKHLANLTGNTITVVTLKVL